MCSCDYESKLKIEKVIPLHLEAVISKLEEMNFEIIQDEIVLQLCQLMK